MDQPPVFDNATCAIVDYAYPKSQAECQDALLWADEVQTLDARTLAYGDCIVEGSDFGGAAIANPYNRHEPAVSGSADDNSTSTLSPV